MEDPTHIDNKAGRFKNKTWLDVKVPRRHRVEDEKGSRSGEQRYMVVFWQLCSPVLIAGYLLVRFGGTLGGLEVARWDMWSVGRKMGCVGLTSPWFE